MPTEADLLIHNSSMLLRLPVDGSDDNALGVIRDGAVAVKDRKVLETGTSTDLLKNHPSAQKVDAGGRMVMPGFVDAHTHLVHGGERAAEMEMRLAGKTYLDILKSGGGIYSTVAATRAASLEELTVSAEKRLAMAAAHGTTTVEIKSGYGLDAGTEMKMLECIASLAESSPLDIVSTYLGAHTLPAGRPRTEVVDELTGPALGGFRRHAEFCDVFCEDGAFSFDESRRILTAAKAAGFRLKIHAGQFNPLGAAGMAAELGAVSADHLEELAPGEAGKMAENGTVAVLLPGVPFFLQGSKYADGRQLIDAGVRLALATDYNPGSCPSYSMPFMIALGVFQCGLSTSEAVRAATTGGAAAIGRQNSLGSLTEGKSADIIILNIEKPEEIPYYFGTNPVHTVYKRGKLITAAARHLNYSHHQRK